MINETRLLATVIQQTDPLKRTLLLLKNASNKGLAMTGKIQFDCHNQSPSITF